MTKKATTAVGIHNFTLIELLVSIAIIGILTSITLPAISKAREEGKRAFCKNNLKQNGYAINIYADDCNGFLPERTGNWCTTMSTRKKGNLMIGKVAKMYDTIETFFCPSVPDRNIGNSRGRNFSYEYNAPRFEQGRFSNAGYAYRKFNDQSMYTLNELNSDYAIVSDLFMLFKGERFPLITHGPDGFNVLYADSSVVWVRDRAQFGSSARGRAVSIRHNDPAIWNALFDR
ncbi:MAG: prepilin-type N-terminal cleavage/methylation domain-containing protein [Lentisphaerales bacterium]|nr:prepilin-type N-terminal cleavage/methylation domain-containing protein [Lentisphaerales bacterium]